MFQMTVEDAMKIRGIVSVIGNCKDRWKFSHNLIDDSGNTYNAYVPLGKDLVVDDSRIMLCINGDVDIENLRGATLRSVS